jgi:multidrug resistance efflux pump
MRRFVIAGVIVVAVAAVAVVVASSLLPGGSGTTTGASSTPLPPVPASATIVAEARVMPGTRAVVAAAVPGTVSEVAVAEGDLVAAGAVIAQLDPTAAQADVAAAQAAVDAATERATQAEAAAAQASAEVDRASAAVRSARAIRDQLPKGAPAAQKRAANADIDGAEAALAAARAARSGAQAAAAAAGADVARASAALDAATAAEAKLSITTPIAGTVADIAVETGDPVAAGSIVARIAGPGGWTFETTDLTQDEVAAIAVGSTATASVDGFAGTPIEGRVARIAAIGEDRQGDVYFTVVVEPTGAVPDGLRWNMVASVQISRAP